MKPTKTTVFFHTYLLTLIKQALIPVSVDADECNASIPVCDANADCKNTLGSYSCSCKAGFLGDGKTCRGEETR